MDEMNRIAVFRHQVGFHFSPGTDVNDPRIGIARLHLTGDSQSGIDVSARTAAGKHTGDGLRRSVTDFFRR